MSWWCSHGDFDCVQIHKIYIRYFDESKNIKICKMLGSETTPSCSGNTVQGVRMSSHYVRLHMPSLWN